MSKIAGGTQLSDVLSQMPIRFKSKREYIKILISRHEDRDITIDPAIDPEQINAIVNKTLPNNK
jgi:hypothetical protein